MARVCVNSCSVRLKPRVSSPKTPPKRTMTNRLEVLDMIHGVMSRIRNAASREQRFNLLENAQMLADILKEVTMYEKSLLMDLDVD